MDELLSAGGTLTTAGSTLGGEIPGAFPRSGLEADQARIAQALDSFRGEWSAGVGSLAEGLGSLGELTKAIGEIARTVDGQLAAAIKITGTSGLV